MEHARDTLPGHKFKKNNNKKKTTLLSCILQQSADIEDNVLSAIPNMDKALRRCPEFIQWVEVPHPDICDCGQKMTFWFFVHAVV